MERFLHRGSVLTGTHQTEMFSAHPPGRVGARAPQVRPQGEEWGWLHENSLKEATVPQIAGRESRKNSGPAKEARDHFFWVHNESGFLLRVPTEGRAPPKRTPETGGSHGY